MVVRSLDVKKDPFRPCEKGEDLLGPEVPYLSAIGAFMYLATCTPNISFPVNQLARYSSAPTRRHWNGIKHILRYLKGTSDMRLFYSKESKKQMQMQGIFHTHTKLNPKPGMYLAVIVLLSHGNLSSKQW